MAILVSDPSLEERLIAERKATGADRYDELWEGSEIVPLAFRLITGKARPKIEVTHVPTGRRWLV